MGDSSVYSTRTQVVPDAAILESSFCSDSLRLALEWGEGSPEGIVVRGHRGRDRGRKGRKEGGAIWAEVKLLIA